MGVALLAWLVLLYLCSSKPGWFASLLVLLGIVTVTCREPMSARAIRVSCSSDGELPLGRRFGSETA